MEIKNFSIFGGILIGIIGIIIMLFGHTTSYDIGASICVYVTACAMGSFITYGLIR